MIDTSPHKLLLKQALTDVSLNISPADYEDFFDLLSGLLHFNPNQRLRPAQALKHNFF